MAEEESGLGLEENEEVTVETAVSDAMDGAAEKEDQELPLDGLDEGGGIEDPELPLEGLDEGGELDLADDGGADELAQQDISEYIEDDGSGELEVGGMAEAGGAADDAQDRAGEAVEDDSDFEEELMGLKAEIASNPEGERVSDLLEKEGIKSAVDDLEFDLPRTEHNLSRAMGVSELPGEGPEGDDAGTDEVDQAEAVELDEPTFAAAMPGEEGPEPGALPTLDLSGGMIDEEMKAKLSEVLDEMITVSVRKAVKEEIPKLMDQLEKENQ